MPSALAEPVPCAQDEFGEWTCGVCSASIGLQPVVGGVCSGCNAVVTRVLVPSASSSATGQPSMNNAIPSTQVYVVGGVSFPLIDEVVFRRSRRNYSSTCPHCGQLVEDRLRSLNWKMCQFLLQLYHKGTTGWHRTREVRPVIEDSGEMGGDAARLRYWHLVEEHSQQRGLWRISVLGVDFLGGTVSVPQKVALAEYRKDNKVIGYCGDLVDVRSVVGTHFDLDELLNSSRPGDPVIQP